MNRKGKLYTVILCLFIMLLLIAAYVQLVKFYSRHSEYGITKDIGGKQSAILLAIQEGERISLYVQEATRLAMREAGKAVRCGEPYLGRTLVKFSDSCTVESGSSGSFRSAFNRYMLAYPGEAMRNAEWEDISEDADNTVIEGIVRIPLVTEVEAIGERGGDGQAIPFSGSYTMWPTDDRRITSPFGTRTQGKSKNHPGLDIGTNGRAGTPVRAIASGEAEYVPDTRNNYAMYIRVHQDDGAIVDYMHIVPLETAVPDSVIVPTGSRIPVEAGQVIGQSALLPPGEPSHLHLQMQFAEVSKDTVESIEGWGRHIGPSGTPLNPADSTYAVTRAADNAAFLNPICFFERNMTESILQGSPFDNERKQRAFEACEQYGVLGIQGGMLTAAAAQPGEPTAQQTQSVPAPADDHPFIKETQANVQRLNLLPAIEEAAAEEEVDPRLMLAVITQESQGNENAISPTGPAGIAQFSADTARGYFAESDRADIRACCNAGQSGAACQDPQQNLCDESADPRFDPAKSVEAQAKLLRDRTGKYRQQNYEQHIAFGIAAYNGGECPVDYVLEELGSSSTLTWERVQARMLEHNVASTRIRCGSSSNYLPDWDQIANYGRDVLRWYGAWGGVTFAGTPFSSESIGYYDLHVRIDEQNPVKFATVLRDAQRAAARCTDATCIRNALYVAGMQQRVNIFPVDLDASIPVCMEKEEAALAYYASQVQWCLSSPDSDCNCPLETQVDTVIAVSGEEMQLQKLGGENVQTAPMAGLAYHTSGDEEMTFMVRAYNSQGVLQGAKGTWQPKAGKMLIDGNEHSVQWLYKPAGNDGVAFTNVPRESCVLPPKAEPYCMQAQQYPDVTSVVYVDNIVATAPQAAISELKAEQQEGSVRITFRAEHHPYVHLTLHRPEGDDESYLNVYDGVPDGIGVQEFIRVDGVYEGSVPYAPQYSITLMDAFLHETAAVRVATQAAAPQSSFELQPDTPQ